MGAPSLPAKYGGRGGGRAADVAFWDAESRYHLPTHLFEVTTRMVLPTLVHWAPEKVEDITRLVRGEDLWCQLFSEPGCGSDLAAIRTRAVRRDDGSWVVDGQRSGRRGRTSPIGATCWPGPVTAAGTRA